MHSDDEMVCLRDVVETLIYMTDGDERISPYSALVGEPIKAKEGAKRASNAIRSIFYKMADEGVDNE